MTLTAAGHPFLAIPAAMLAGACAGFVTAFLQTKLGVPSILAGIVTNTGLYTVNLMAMGWKANQSLLKQDTIFTLFRATGIGGDWNPILLSGGITVLAGVLLVAFLAPGWASASAPPATTGTWCAPPPSTPISPSPSACAWPTPSPACPAQ